MNYVYIIVYNSTTISQEGYDSYEKAVEFVNNRVNSPQQIDHWNFKDTENNTYKIKEIQIR